MYRILFLFLIIGLVASSAHAADDPVQKAMKAYEKHRYEDAARELRAAFPSLEQSKQSPARLTLGMIYLKNGELHQGLAHMSAEVNADYLKRLSSDRGAGRSMYSDLYLGLALLEGGQGTPAQAPVIGVGLGIVATALKVTMGIERSYLGRD